MNVLKVSLYSIRFLLVFVISVFSLFHVNGFLASFSNVYETGQTDIHYVVPSEKANVPNDIWFYIEDLDHNRIHCGRYVGDERSLERKGLTFPSEWKQEFKDWKQQQSKKSISLRDPFKFKYQRYREGSSDFINFERVF